MNEQDKEVLKAAKACFDIGYTNAPTFCAMEDIQPPDLLRTFMYGYNEPTPAGPDQLFRDAGAIYWCLEQLEKGDGIDHSWCDGVED